MDKWDDYFESRLYWELQRLVKRKLIIELSKVECEAVLYAISNFTNGNARDISEMQKDVLTRKQALALFQAESKISAALTR